MSTVTIRDMLTDYADRLAYDLEIRRAATRAQPMPKTLEGLDARAAELREQAKAGDHLAQVCTSIAAWEAGRQADLRARFAGEAVPTNPLELLAMWATLLEDMDHLAQYVGIDGWEETPLFDTWGQVHGALTTLQPATPNAATAIAYGAKWDAEAGLGDDWDQRRVELAWHSALPPPRAR